MVVPPLDATLAAVARTTKGFLPDDEGLALYAAACRTVPSGPLVEIGSYCGRSTVYLGAAARATRRVVFSIDHHRGSEENQPGEEYHDPDLVDAHGRVDTLGCFRATIARAGLDDYVVAIVGESTVVARAWSTPVALLFIDGGHSAAATHADYESWAPELVTGGMLAIHDVFPDPADGGRPPFEIYRRALASGAFEETDGCGSLRVLRRVADGI
ncbi:MAG TPA: class I SAM-dependent methyltransferase [Actinomycetota bacterium]|nr:class I SAM-dependent methyltransferase [Actinomycetota bacterium]